MRRRDIAILVSACVVLAMVAAVLIRGSSPPKLVTVVTGAVLRDEGEPDKQRPIERATITANAGPTFAEATSDAAGFFRLQLRPPVATGEPIRLTVRHPNYQVFEIAEPAEDRIRIVRLLPAAPEVQPAQPNISVANMRVRYTLRATTTMDVGSVARTFEVVNTGNIPCNRREPCSPDGKWKAALNSYSFDAPAGTQFRDVRLSCIAGPCPFTRIESDRYTSGGRVITVAVRNWSDTVTYLLEAVVADTLVGESVRRSYPVTFGRAMNFTLPATAEGPSIEAEVDGAAIVFPLGPKATLTWANCKVETGANGSRLYRCELKPNYRFR